MLNKSDFTTKPLSNIQVKNVGSEKALINRGVAFLLRRNLAARDAVIKLVIIILKIVRIYGYLEEDTLRLSY